MGCHPSHWLIFFKMVIAPPSRWEMLESSHLIEDKNPMYCGPFFIFPYIGNSNPNWRTPSFFKRVIASPTSIAIEEHHFFNGWIIGLYQTGPCLQRAAKKKPEASHWLNHPWWATMMIGQSPTFRGTSACLICLMVQAAIFSWIQRYSNHCFPDGFVCFVDICQLVRD